MALFLASEIGLSRKNICHICPHNFPCFFHVRDPQDLTVLPQERCYVGTKKALNFKALSNTVAVCLPDLCNTLCNTKIFINQKNIGLWKVLNPKITTGQTICWTVTIKCYKNQQHHTWQKSPALWLLTLLATFSIRALQRDTQTATLSHIHTRSAAKIYLPLTDYY